MTNQLSPEEAVFEIKTLFSANEKKLPPFEITAVLTTIITAQREQAVSEYINNLNRDEVVTSGNSEVQGVVTSVSRDAGDQRPAVRSGLVNSEVINKDASPGLDCLPELITIRLENERMRKALENMVNLTVFHNAEHDSWLDPKAIGTLKDMAKQTLSTRTETPVAEEVLRLAQIALSLNQHDDYNGYGIYRRARGQVSNTTPAVRQALENYGRAGA